MGCVRRNGKKWQYVFDLPRDATGRRRQRTKGGFNSKREALSAMARAQAEADSADRSTGTPELGTWLQHDWLPSHRTTIRRSTAASYSAIVRLHVAGDAIAAIPLADVTAIDVNAFLSRVAEKPGRSAQSTLSRKTLKNVYMLLKAAFDSAVETELLSSNIVKKVPKPKPPKPEIQVWTAGETRRFLAKANDDSNRLFPLYQLAAVTGMRRGELAGLQWRHVDFATRSLRIEQTVIYADGETYIEQPKTEWSRRTIHLGDHGLEALRRQKEQQRDDALALGSDWKDTGYVFASATGERLHPDYITKRFERDVAASGVRRIKFHGLRHTFATNALAAGENPKQVSEILGHSSIQTTLGLYSQHLPGSHEQTIRSLEARLFEPPQDTEGGPA